MDKMDLDTFAEVFGPHYNSVFDYIYPITLDVTSAEEITQEVYLKAYKYPNTFLNYEDLEAALKTAAKNKFIDAARKEKRRAKLHEKVEIALILRETDRTTTDILQLKELRKFLLISIRELPPQLRQIIALNYQSGIPMHEIAEILDIKYTTALSRKKRALKQLRINMKKHGISDISDVTFLFLSLLLRF